MESPKICPIFREPCLSNFSTIFQKAADGINAASRLKNDNLIVTPGMHVQVSGRNNYTRTPGVPSSSAEVFDRKTRTSSGGFNFRKDCFYCGCIITERENKTKKSCNVSCKNREVDKAVHQTIFDRKDDECSTKVKGRLAFVKDLRAENAVYIYSLVQIFGLVKVIQRKALCRKNVEDVQLKTKKQCFSKSLNIQGLTQMNSLILQLCGK